MARAALEIGVRDLAEIAGVSAMTVTRFENGKSAGYPDTLAKLKAALEAAGVEFIPENGGGPGVRLRKRTSAADEGLRPDQLTSENTD
jgi:transcriptional regulator with XRE-family HTH domain